VNGERVAQAVLGGNITRAVAELGITRQKAYRMLQALKPES
jgi:hypothetical protein